MTETMKVLEAIGQIKIQEKRLRNAVDEMNLVVANRITAKKVNGIDKEEFERRAKSSYESVMTLLKRYMALKEAVNEFNAATKIKIGDREMTVASALYQKEYGINQQKSVVAYMMTQLSDQQSKVNHENGSKLDDAAERNAKQNFDGDPKSDATAYLKFLEDYKESHQYVLVDPLKIMDKIQKLNEEIAAFEAGVDTQIQIANATHDITIEY